MITGGECKLQGPVFEEVEACYIWERLPSRQPFTEEKRGIFGVALGVGKRGNRVGFVVSDVEYRVKLGDL
jgi:hypothetical protein